MDKVKNFARFFALLKRMPHTDEDIKEKYVSAFTNGRTVSLHDMTPLEYGRMCDDMQKIAVGVPDRICEAEVKRYRSAVLKRLQRLGIDTTDWTAVDNFCFQSRIAGKAFGKLSVNELKGLIPRLEAIDRKGKNEQHTAVQLSDRELKMLVMRASSQIPN